MPKLNPNAQKWVDALRSGKYKQTTSTLKDQGYGGPRHCCLGVLCELAVEDGVIDSFIEDEAYLPQDVQRWAGLKTSMANFRDKAADENSEGGSLVHLNDSGCSFAQIADAIEEHAEELGVAAHA